MDEKLHYRLFAKLIMFVTLLLGGFIGYVSGFNMGKQQTLELIQEGRQIEQTTARSTASTTTAADQLTSTQLECYQSSLGESAYTNFLAGTTLTADQETTVAACADVEATTSPTVTETTTPAVVPSTPAQ